MRHVYIDQVSDCVVGEFIAENILPALQILKAILDKDVLWVNDKLFYTFFDRISLLLFGHKLFRIANA